MAVDYDLVIIGGSPTARYAAMQAAQRYARVALIESDAQQASAAGQSQLYHQALLHAAHLMQQWSTLPPWGISPGDCAPSERPSTLQWQALIAQAQRIAAHQAEWRSLPVLAAAGVDVVIGTGEFQRRPHLTFLVNGRSLRARAYLIATPTQPYIPVIEGLNTVRELTPDHLWQADWQTLPEQITILGGDPQAIELAQALQRLGSQVTLIVDNKRLLTAADTEAIALVQAQLEAEGVCIWTHTPVTQIKQLNNQTWLQAGNQAIETQTLILAMGRQPAVEHLNLAGVGVKQHPWGIAVNPRLQTTNPRIYACGEVLGGYALAQVAQHEADVALHNALFFNRERVRYPEIPWAIATDPELVQIGLTERRARRQFGEEVLVLRQPFKSVSHAQIQGKTTGFCKLIARQQTGQLLGASLVGSQAREAAGAIALAIRHRLTIEQLAQIPAIAPSFAELLQQTASDWHYQRIQRNIALRDRLENWFDFRRNWSR